MSWLKDFIWGTFNYRNKGIKWYRWPLVGFDFANIRPGTKVSKSRKTQSGSCHSKNS